MPLLRTLRNGDYHVWKKIHALPVPVPESGGKESVDKTIVELDPIRLTEQFVDARCDCIYVQDLSENDKEHDEAVDVIRELCSHSLIPVIGGGHLLRMEDVTKLFYAGCRKVTVNLENGAETALFEEVSLKFGKDRIVAGVDSPAKIQEYREAIEKYASEVYLFHAGGSGEARSRHLFR